MDLATQSHLTTLRGELEYQLAELLATARAEDEAGRNFDEIRLVEAALHRLGIGRYGDCADCGEPIGLQRLLVLPAAEHCAACQAVVEQRVRDAIGGNV